MALATLSIDIVTKLASLEEGLDRAGRLAEKQAAKIDKAFSGLRVAAAGLGGVLAGAFSVAAAQQFFASTVDGIDALNDLKDATGASIENISALEDIGARAGHSFESVSTSLIRFNKVLQDAGKDGSEAARVLQALGLNAEELKRLDPAEALRQTAVAMAQFADDGDKARAVQILFGKSVQEVVPFLNDLAEKGALVGTVTKEQADAADQYNKQLAALQKNTTDWARSITSDLLPALNTFFERMKGIQKAGGFGKSVGLELDANMLSERLNTVVRDIERFQAFVDKNPNSNARIRLAQLREEYASLQAQLTETTGALKRFGNTASPMPPSAQEAFRRMERDSEAKKSLGNVPDKPEKDTKKRTEKLIDGLPLDRVEAFRQSELAATAKVNEALATEQLAEAEKDRANALALEAEQINATSEAQQRLNDRLQSLLDASPSAELERTRDDMRLLSDAFEKGAITAEQFNEAAQARLGTLPENFKAASDKMTVFAEEAARNIQDQLGDTILQAMEGDFDSIEDGWKRMLNRMVAEALAADIGNALFPGGKPSFGGAMGQAGDALQGIAGAVGAYFGATDPSSAYAVNGSDFGFQLAEGTNFVPYDGMPATLHKGEAVVPAKYNPANGGMGGGGLTQHNTFYIDGRVDQASTAQLINQALQANNRAWEERMAAQGRR